MADKQFSVEFNVFHNGTDPAGDYGFFRMRLHNYLAFHLTIITRIIFPNPWIHHESLEKIRLFEKRQVNSDYYEIICGTRFQ